MSLLCPKCMNPMRQYERNRVVVDQCVECGGLFLDRGELESLVLAERSYYGEVPQPAAVAGPPPDVYAERQYDDRYRDPGERRYDDRPYEDRRRYDDRYYGKSRKRKARSFLEELFDD